MLDITPIVQAIMAVIWAIILCLVVPFVRAKTNDQQRQNISEYVKIAVAAAEQLFKGSGRGQEKKQYVLTWLAERNITVDDSKIDAMIESAVYQLSSGEMLLAQPVEYFGTISTNTDGSDLEGVTTTAEGPL